MNSQEKSRQTIPDGTVVVGCRIKGFLGRGGMGEVYLAEHLGLERLVAIKVLRSELTDRRGVERFLKEARMAARIDDPNVVTIHDIRHQDDNHYIIMQYVNGRNLAELVELQNGAIGWFSAAKVIRFAAKGLHAVHRLGLIYRDIKPSNIMLSSDSRVLLMDFGLVREEKGSDLTSMGQLLGTPHFMSPEQCRGEVLDRRSDIYSLGATFYYLVAGRTPFRGKLHELLTRLSSNAAAPHLHTIDPRIPRDVSDLVAKAMSPRCESRFPDAVTLGKGIGKLLRSAQLADTESWETLSMGGTLVATQATPVIPELAPLELVPTESKWEIVKQKLPWVGAAVVVANLILVLILFAFNAPHQEQKEAETILPANGVGIDAADSNAPSSGSKVPSRVGMVRIEAGFVRLGNDAEKVRVFVSQYVQNPVQYKEVLSVVAQEPQARAGIAAFWIDQFEVTNAEYALFIRESGRTPPTGWIGDQPPPGKGDHPVINVAYGDAESFASWAGKKLPTRDQWMRAARGDKDWLFPWGDTYDVSRANVGDNPAFNETSPVTMTPNDASLFKVYNLVGNVDEFVRGSFTFRGQPYRMVKGASYRTRGHTNGILSFHQKYGLAFLTQDTGFRCVIEE